MTREYLMTRRDWIKSAGACGLAFSSPVAAVSASDINFRSGVIDIGSRRELFLDDYLIERMRGVEQKMHRPLPQEVVLTFDKPWEGSGSGGYVSIVKCEDCLRMYYKAWHLVTRAGKLSVPHPLLVACAESRDGIKWSRPHIGRFEFDGSKQNNIIWRGNGCHGFSAFKDANPDCPAEARYKAVGAAERATSGAGLFAMKSPDGLHWSPTQNEPIITQGKFDSQNVAFWDAQNEAYRAYIRETGPNGRDIATATSRDFIKWSRPQLLQYPGARKEQLYTNQIQPYYRAPHIFIGFPTRYIDRGWTPSMEHLPDIEHRRQRARANRRYGTALTEALLMSSRDGHTFHRRGEAFLRPGIQRPGTWHYGQQYLAWPVIETRSTRRGAPNELSLFASESYWTGKASQLRRHTLRIDGFVSINAAMSGGELVTKPLKFKGAQLAINFSSSAAGSVRVEIQDASGDPIGGYALNDCDVQFGDQLERVVSWKNTTDVGPLSGKTIRLRFELRDADVYSFRFSGKHA